ncbi:MAG: glycosyltransferase family 39 protein, partial [Candidatus Roizmanbacteria bacterium]|nr:glycosyltransferase family 39 protein [Candidatus Roizmanbacteria bacterium]
MIDVVALWQWLAKRTTKTDVLIVMGLIALFFTTRLIGILDLPMFTDEAIYIHWAKLAWKDASWRFVSLTDGRQPLQTWATIPFLKLIDDPLLAGRMFGVMSGLFGFVGVMILAGYLFGKKTAYIGGLLYLLNPYFLFYDRMAMVDSAVSAFFTWSLLGTLLLLRFPRLDIAIIYGLIIGLGSLSKSTARVFLLVPALIPIVWYWGDSKKIRKTINYYLLLGVVAVFMVGLYNIQRLSPFMHFIEGKNLTFVRTIPQFIASPFDPLIHNLLTIPQYVGIESAFLLPIFGIIGLIVMARKNLKLSLFLSASFLVPFGIIASLAIVLFPRYLMFLTIPLFLGMLYLVQNTRYRVLVIVLYGISVTYPLWAIYFNLNKLYLPPID